MKTTIEEGIKRRTHNPKATDRWIDSDHLTSSLEYVELFPNFTQAIKAEKFINYASPHIMEIISIAYCIFCYE